MEELWAGIIRDYPPPRRSSKPSSWPSVYSGETWSDRLLSLLPGVALLYRNGKHSGTHNPDRARQKERDLRSDPP